MACCIVTAFVHATIGETIVYLAIEEKTNGLVAFAFPGNFVLFYDDNGKAHAIDDEIA